MAIQFVPTKCPACSGQLDIDLENKTAVCKYCQTVHEDAGIGLQRKKFQETERP